MRRLPVLAAALLLMPGLAAAEAPSAQASSIDVVYVSPTGKDGNDGRSASTPVRTLTKAQQLLETRRGDRAAEVRLAGGTYSVSGLRWFHYRAGRYTTIRGTGIGGEARLDGGSRSTVLVIHPRHPTSVKIVLSNLKITNAINGLRVNNANDVTIDRVTFYRLGGTYAPGVGYSAVGVNYSHRVTVRNSTFNQTRNSGSSSAGLFHAIYIAHNSDAVRVEGSKFLLVSGDPVRLRNGSDGAEVRGNTFERAGSGSYISDWYSAGEAPSRGAVFTGNVVKSGYTGARLSVSRCFDSWAHVCAPSRINASGNR